MLIPLDGAERNNKKLTRGGLKNTVVLNHLKQLHVLRSVYRLYLLQILRMPFQINNLRGIFSYY
jgi:hypothetical protein